MTHLLERLSKFVLLAGVVATSFSSIIIKGSTSAPSVIAAYRLGLTVVLLVIPACLFERLYLMPFTRSDLLRSLLSGVFLATHFLSWITSLKYTSVAGSVALVSSHTLFIMAYTRMTTKKRFSTSAVAAVFVALAGTVLIGFDGWRSGPMELWGNALAVVGALGMAGYCVLGEAVRRRVGVLNYAVLVYATAAAILFAVSAVSGQNLRVFEASEWRIFWALAIIPTVFGHTLFNWVLKYLPAEIVSAAALGEPAGAALLAYALLEEVPTLPVLFGGALVVGGLSVFLYRDGRDSARHKSDAGNPELPAQI